MNGRDALLDAVRAAQPEPLPHPGSAPEGEPDAADLVAAFVRSLEAAGGVVAAGPAGELLAERFPDARIASTVPGVEGSVDLDGVADPHDLVDLDVLVCPAELGVAENGAVWLPEEAMGRRAAPFLAQHMVVVLWRGAIVADLHAAYRRLEVDASAFGLFVAGPSKTADIEQSLVLGAHGPRSLTLLFTDDGDA